MTQSIASIMKFHHYFIKRYFRSFVIVMILGGVGGMIPLPVYANEAKEFEVQTTQFADGFEKLLKEVVIKQTFQSDYGKFHHHAIDYKKLTTDSTVKTLMDTEVKRLAGWKSLPSFGKEHLAFLINAYNFYTLKAIADEYPVKSIKAIGWKRKNIAIGGKKFTLDEIEHDNIRPLGDARTHFALNCASVSCPTLLAVPYRQATLNKVLAEQVKMALTSPLHVQQTSGGFFSSEGLLVSRVFKWFKEDFEDNGNSKMFILRYLPPGLLAVLEEKNPPGKSKSSSSTKLVRLAKELDLSYLSYNWNLNTVENIHSQLEEFREEGIKVTKVQ